jgi:hypothetical protein
MEQAGEVDYPITWRDNEFVGRVSLTPCRRAGVNRRRFAFPKLGQSLLLQATPPGRHTRRRDPDLIGDSRAGKTIGCRRPWASLDVVGRRPWLR